MGQQDSIKIQDVWLLHFIRDTDCSHDEEQKHDHDLKEYYVFDYYDRMVCKRGGLDYDQCLGLTGELRDYYAKSSVASSYLTLTSLVSDDCKQDPFLYNAADLPFLSLVNITAMADHTETNSMNISEKDVSYYLFESIQFLQKAVERFCTCFFEGKQAEDSPLPVCFRVLHSMNSGNYCVAIRSAYEELGYYVAMSIRSLVMPALNGFPQCQFSTFTITCMQYTVDQNNIAAIPTQISDRRYLSEIVLRLSIDQKLIGMIAPLAASVGNGRGLYGRYDVTISLSMEQFMRIYPWICACKFGTVYPDDAALSGLQDDNLEQLALILKNRQEIRCLNERILVSCSVLNTIPPRDGEDFHQNHVKRVNTERNEIEQKIVELRKEGKRLPFYEREFIYYINLIDDVWSDFENLRLQDDSFVNGNVFYSQIWLVLDIIHSYLKSIQTGADYSEDEEMRHAFRDLITHLRRAANSVNHFQKLMQSVNQQSMQAPNYDIQMHCDLEKLVLAHTEFARSFLSTRFRSGIAGPRLSADHQAILPLYTVESHRESISARPLFLLPYIISDDKRLCVTNPAKERLILSIMLPSIDTLGDFYQTIPLICHELAHNFRVVTRKERNDALSRFIMDKLSDYIVRQWISRSCEDSIYIAFGDIEHRIQNIFSDILLKGYLDFVGNIHDNSNIGVLLTNCLVYLCENIFFVQDAYSKYSQNVTINIIKQYINNLAVVYQGVASLEKAVWYEDYKKYMSLLSEEKQTTINETERDQIKKLAKAMASSSLEGYFSWCMKEFYELDQFIDKHFSIKDEDEQEQVKNLKRWIKRLAAHGNKVAFNQQRVDRMFVGLEEEKGEFKLLFDHLRFTNIKDGLVDSEKEKIDSASVQKQFRAKKHNAYNAMMELIQKSKDISLLFRCITIPVTTRPLREPFLKDLRYRLREWIAVMKDSDPMLWTLFGSEKVQSYLLPLGLDQESDSIFRNSVISVLDGIPVNTIETIVRDSTNIYREIFADLGMCAPLKLDVFGYLMVLSSAKTFRGNGFNGGTEFDTFGIERAMTVCYTISYNKPSDLEKRSLDYSSKTLSEIESFLTEEGRRTTTFKNYRDKIEKLLELPSVEYREERMPVLNGLSAYLLQEERDNCEKLMEKMKLLWCFSMYVSFYRASSVDNVNKRLLEHFRQLYHVHMKDETFNTMEDSHVLLNIGDAYNSGEISAVKQKDSEFKDSLAFVLYHYYRSWRIYGSGCCKENMREWTDSLMGDGMLYGA